MKNLIMQTKKDLIFISLITGAVFSLIFWGLQMASSSDLMAKEAFLQNTNPPYRGIALSSSDYQPERLCARGFRSNQFNQFENICSAWRDRKDAMDFDKNHKWTFAVGFAREKSTGIQFYQKQDAQKEAYRIIRRQLRKELGNKASKGGNLPQIFELGADLQRDGSLLVLMGLHPDFKKLALDLNTKKQKETQKNRRSNVVQSCPTCNKSKYPKSQTLALLERIAQNNRDAKSKTVAMNGSRLDALDVYTKARKKSLALAEEHRRDRLEKLEQDKEQALKVFKEKLEADFEKAELIEHSWGRAQSRALAKEQYRYEARKVKRIFDEKEEKIDAEARRLIKRAKKLYGESRRELYSKK